MRRPGRIPWIGLALLVVCGRAASPVEPGAAAASQLEQSFNSGLTLQRQAAESATEQERTARLAEAAKLYERALEIDPNSGGTLNNLAQVYADLGRDADAERLFERAVALDVRLRPFYNRNYADFLAHRGDWARAEEHYRKALEDKPDDLQAHESLTAVLAAHRLEGLPEYLWFLIGHGQMLRAEEEALKRLDQGKEYLTILVASLAEQSYRPEEFSSSPAAQALRALSGASEGARAVLELHEGKDFEPASYRWWAEEGQTPRQAFRHLIRSLGETERKAELPDVARSYFRLSILLTQAEPDLEAFRKLVALPSSSEDVAAVGRLVEWNERLLSHEPQVSKQSGLYLYRHDLGLFYSLFKHWEGEGPASGIYQLSQATQMKGIGPPDGPPDTATFDARVYTRLAAGYTETGKPERARQTLTSLVAAYRAQGMEAEAAALQWVLNPNPGRRRPLDRRREVFDDPPLRLQDFTTEPAP